MAEKRGTRFVVTYQEGNMVPFTQILTDKITGIQYLLHCPLSGSAAMEVLIDETGKPIINKSVTKS